MQQQEQHLYDYYETVDYETVDDQLEAWQITGAELSDLNSQGSAAPWWVRLDGSMELVN